MFGVTEGYTTFQATRQEWKVALMGEKAGRKALNLSKEHYRLRLASVGEVTTATASLMTASVVTTVYLLLL